MSVLGPILGPVLGPVALSLTRAGVPMWSPRVLFAAGEQGAWYDPSDLSTLFQDSVGTTPVTAVGQPVGLLKDKSGRGNHASQSTTTARPTLQQDSGGRYYLSRDGVDDNLNIPGNAMPSGVVTVAIGTRITAFANWVDLVRRNWIINGFAMNVDASGNFNFGIAKAGAKNSVVGGAMTTGSPYVLMATYDGTTQAAYLNGVAGGSASVTGYSTDTTAITYGDSDGGATYRDYGSVWLGRAATAAERAQINRYLAARSGVTL